MGKRRQEKALGSYEARVAARKLNPKGRFINGSSAQKARDKINGKKQQPMILPYVA